MNQAIQHTLESGQNTDSSWKEHSPKTDCIYLISCLAPLSSCQIVTTLIENQYRAHDRRDPLVVSICCIQKSWLEGSVHQRWSTILYHVVPLMVTDTRKWSSMEKRNWLVDAPGTSEMF